MTKSFHLHNLHPIECYGAMAHGINGHLPQVDIVYELNLTRCYGPAINGHLPQVDIVYELNLTRCYGPAINGHLPQVDIVYELHLTRCYGPAINSHLSQVDVPPHVLHHGELQQEDTAVQPRVVQVRGHR